MKGVKKARRKLNIQLLPVASAPVFARASFLGVSPTSVQMPGAQLKEEGVGVSHSTRGEGRQRKGKEGRGGKTDVEA